MPPAYKALQFRHSFWLFLSTSPLLSWLLKKKLNIIHISYRRRDEKVEGDKIPQPHSFFLFSLPESAFFFF